MPDIPLLIKVMSRLHIVAYRLTKGRVGGRLGKAPVLLLTSTGRRSGARRTNPLLYVPIDDGYAVVASNAGNDRPPGWFHNLQSDPQATVEDREETVTVTARVATDDEKQGLWPSFVAVYPTYDTYQRRTERSLAVVILERAAA